MPEKIRFAIVGSGWRSLYFVRAAKRLPEYFELTAMLCRTEQKAALMADKHGIRTVTAEDDLIRTNPEFLVVAVSEASLAAVTLYWLGKGFAVLAETSPALTREDLKKMKAAHLAGAKLAIAEQYLRCPQNIAREKLIRSGIIGEPSCLYLSLAHEYHAASLMRRFLAVPCDMPCTVSAREFSFPTARTKTRYDDFHDGLTADKKRVMAVLSYENGKVCLYDFDSEQYRSSIRSGVFRLQGVRGEILNDTVLWLDPDHIARKDTIQTALRTVKYEEENPNLRLCIEVEEITFRGEVLYTPPFGPAGLSEDETAVADMLQGMGLYARGGASPYPLEEALADARTAILIREAAASGKELSSRDAF